MRIARLQNVDLHWREDGDPAGYPIVFANSLGTDLRLWDAVVDSLPGNGFRYIRYDKRGHGLSSCPSPPYSMTALVQDLEALLDHVGITSCGFVGLSIGGMIGQLLASRNPELVSRMVLACTAARMGTPDMWRDRVEKVRGGGLNSIADAVLERWFSQTFRMTDESLAWRHMLCRTPTDGYIGCSQAIAAADLTESTAALTLPVLAIAGSEDLASPPDQVRATADLVEGGRFVEVSGAGHLPCIEQPDLFADLVRGFLMESDNVRTI